MNRNDRLFSVWNSFNSISQTEPISSTLQPSQIKSYSILQGYCNVLGCILSCGQIALFRLRGCNYTIAAFFIWVLFRQWEPQAVKTWKQMPCTNQLLPLVRNLTWKEEEGKANKKWNGIEVGKWKPNPAEAKSFLYIFDPNSYQFIYFRCLLSDLKGQRSNLPCFRTTASNKPGLNTLH